MSSKTSSNDDLGTCVNDHSLFVNSLVGNVNLKKLGARGIDVESCSIAEIFLILEQLKLVKDQITTPEPHRKPATPSAGFFKSPTNSDYSIQSVDSYSSTAHMSDSHVSVPNSPFNVNVDLYNAAIDYSGINFLQNNPRNPIVVKRNPNIDRMIQEVNKGSSGSVHSSRNNSPSLSPSHGKGNLAGSRAFNFSHVGGPVSGPDSKDPHPPLTLQHVSSSASPRTHSSGSTSSSHQHDIYGCSTIPEGISVLGISSGHSPRSGSAVGSRLLKKLQPPPHPSASHDDLAETTTDSSAAESTLLDLHSEADAAHKAMAALSFVSAPSSSGSDDSLQAVVAGITLRPTTSELQQAQLRMYRQMREVGINVYLALRLRLDLTELFPSISI